jgi:hypothetical protein
MVSEAPPSMREERLFVAVEPQEKGGLQTWPRER